MVYRTHSEHFLGRIRDNLYTITHFEARVASGSASSTNRNAVSRLRNCVVNCYNATQKIPKWIVIIVENDLIKFLKYTEYAVTDAYEAVLNWIFDELKEVRDEIRKRLPFKTKKNGWPYYLWIEPTMHKSYSDLVQRRAFLESLRKVSSGHNESITLPLQQGWDDNNEDLFMERERRYSTLSVRTFWTALDKTVMFADMRMLRNHSKTLQEVFKQNIWPIPTSVLNGNLYGNPSRNNTGQSSSTYFSQNENNTNYRPAAARSLTREFNNFPRPSLVPETDTKFFGENEQKLTLFKFCNC